jgi:succinate-acetate transporter protein
LQPVAAPSILGLFGFAASTFIVAANLAGWYGNDSTPLVLFPFVTVFGGVAQFLAGMWSYRARDGLATAMHGMWGSFWIAYGFYFLLVATRVLPAPSVSHTAQVGFGYWFIVLAAISWLGAAAAVAENLGLTLVLVTLAAGATLLAIGWVASIMPLVTIGAIVLVASAVLAFYTAGAMMLRGTFGRVVLPVGRTRAANAPGSVPVQPIQYERGEPGVKVGQ